MCCEGVIGWWCLVECSVVVWVCVGVCSLCVVGDYEYGVCSSWWLASSSRSVDFVCRVWLITGCGVGIRFWVFVKGSG